MSVRSLRDGLPEIRMRLLVLLAALLAMPAAAAPSDVQANTGTTRLDFTPREWLDVGLEVNGVTVERLKLHPPGKMTSLMVKHDAANRGTIVVTNETQVVVSPAVAIAVFDAEGRLLAAANTGVRLKSLKPGETKDLEIHFGGVFRHLEKGRVLYVSLEF
jgi:hypothetical protein